MTLILTLNFDLDLELVLPVVSHQSNDHCSVRLDDVESKIQRVQFSRDWFDEAISVISAGIVETFALDELEFLKIFFIFVIIFGN